MNTRKIINNLNNISPTLNSKLVYLNRIKNNLPVYNGGLGENPLPTPKYLVEAMEKNLTKKEYTSIEGRSVFKNAVFSHYSNNLNKVIVSNGLKELIFSLSFNWENKIFIPVPCWVTYLKDMKILKKDYYKIECNSNSNFKLTSENLEKALIENNGKDSLLFLNNPTNPTGSVYSPSELQDLSKIFKKYNLTVFADEIYFNTSQTKTLSISKVYDKCIIGSSLSKDWASGGWRFGWMLFNDNLKELHQKMTSFGSIMYSCPSDFLNDVGAEALLNNGNKEHFNKQKEYFKNISDNVENELKGSKIISSDFEGAWYKWLDLVNYKNKLEKLNINNSKELTESLGNNLGLIVVPGHCFGIEGLTFRLSMIDTNIHIGVRKLVAWLNS